MLVSALKRVWCRLFFHDLIVSRVFSPEERQCVCRRCNKVFAMHDGAMAFVEWDGTFDELYKGIENDE